MKLERIMKNMNIRLFKIAPVLLALLFSVLIVQLMFENSYVKYYSLAVISINLLYACLFIFTYISNYKRNK